MSSAPLLHRESFHTGPPPPRPAPRNSGRRPATAPPDRRAWGGSHPPPGSAPPRSRPVLRGQDNDRDGREGRVAPPFLQELPTVHPRHREVEQDEAEPLAPPQPCQRLL